ncbi:MAG: rhomboid family intramembrane serine protease [Clostridia bacterium]|nr:rhomboid family intramembrane serine protease [Clostridia bacterium]MCL6522293.1 rhomboid family intramembrane serine protease [Bacillota bacterium]
MIPVGDDVRSRRFPWVTLLLVAANILIFLHELGMTPDQLDLFYSRWGLIPARVVASWTTRGPLAPSSWEPLLTAIFLHGSWLHVIGNMIFLWIFGDNVEDLMGHARYLLFYLLTGVIGNGVQTFFYPASTVVVIGASGAIAGVLGAYLVKYPWARVTTVIPLGFFIVPLHIPAAVFLVFWFAVQFLSGAASLGVEYASGGVAYWVHVGGFLAGAALVSLFQTERTAPYTRR